ncbi:CesT family type III secretion system chaperone [Iodobacter fluviatilis]|uniref:Tir chaperone family protein CesT n=1 Tax=Iodobacter fluviatilis TaxID=537 RepID=A0A377Q6C5_9NEIS|nr:CesT family type III secretion system chaperone [Iodobacter fluviatilis]TCU81182.1 Tir chaperone family protein CesT [Iodobacter fluviatilis]STQ90159.1 YopE regulator [Iodobacter fluviatilis]
MPANFNEAINSLCLRLDLPRTVQHSDIVNLSIGEHAIHITAQPSQMVLMFCCIDSAKIIDSLSLLQLNLFDKNCLKPILSQDAHSNDWVLWSRQLLDHASDDSLYEQLELLSDFADKLVAGEC